ncbi:MAG: circadian clock protein KaiC [Methanosarcinaceae archaeon]|nr:circadian clock protein KaiC [Methanosarcinaceae archaeon]
MMRVPTSIPGFDELVEGGFVENDVILVTGGPGAGKTTFGIQYLYEGISRYNEPGIYLTLEESPARTIRNMWRFNWDLERLIKEDKLRIISADRPIYEKHSYQSINSDSNSDERETTIETLIKNIAYQMHEIGAKRLVIDSITSLKISADPVEVRHLILGFITQLEKLDCTTLVTSELPDKSENFSVEEYLVEGVVRLHTFRVGGRKNRAIEILKMRGVKHDEQIHHYSITDNGIIIRKGTASP